MAKAKAQPTTAAPLEAVFSWTVPEHDHYHRSKQWYIWAGVAVVGLFLFSSLSISLYPFSLSFAPNFLFIVIIILTATVVVLTDGNEPARLGFAITDEGIVIGDRFIDFDELKNFSIVYKPRQGVKRLYFEFHSFLRPRLSIPMDDANPLKIRDFLLNYLEEDLEREAEPVSERFSRMFKI